MKNKICAKCRGKCCKTGAMIHKSEVKLLPPVKLIRVNRKFYRTEEPCPFLTSKGCILNYIPISCRLYPFALVKGNFMVKTSCPHWNRFNNKNLEEVEKELRGNEKFFWGIEK